MSFLQDILKILQKLFNSQLGLYEILVYFLSSENRAIMAGDQGCDVKTSERFQCLNLQSVIRERIVEGRQTPYDPVIFLERDQVPAYQDVMVHEITDMFPGVSWREENLHLMMISQVEHLSIL